MKKILVIEDSIDFQELLKYTFRSEYLIATASQISEARRLLNENSFDLILLDLNLPDGDGITFFTEIRNTPLVSRVPVVFLTAQTSEENMLAAYALGANDYIAKPIQRNIFHAKISSLLNHRGVDNVVPLTLKYKNLHFDLSTQRVLQAEHGDLVPLSLTQIEYRILLEMVKQPQIIHSRQQIKDAVWGAGILISDRCVDSHINKIRKKINSDIIHSIRGCGYCLTEIIAKAS